MKNLLYILLISGLFISCSSSNDDEPTPEDTTPILVTKESQTTETGNIYYYNIKYDGDKIVESVEDNTFKNVYTYNGDNIVKIVTSDGNIEKEISEFAYSNDRLVSEKVTDKRLGTLVYTINYTYENDNKVKYKKFYGSTYNPTTGQHSNLLFSNAEAQISNGNVVKVTETFDSPNENYTEIEETTYDNKNNPYKNIRGMLKIQLSGGRDWVAKNNITKVSQTHTGSLTYFDNESMTYIYNNSDYPIQKTTKYTSSEYPEKTEIYTFEYNK